MIRFRVSVMVASVVLLGGMTGMCHAADTASQGGNGAAAEQPATAAPESPGDAAGVVVKLKTSGRKGHHAEPELLPGQQLTVKQVLNILKTTRNLSGMNLSGLKLIGVNLSKCNLRGVNLRGADLERADLGESNLERADLSGANLKMVNLQLSGLTAANLNKADLSGAIWKDGKVCAPSSIGQCREAIPPTR